MLNFMILFLIIINGGLFLETRNKDKFGTNVTIFFMFLLLYIYVCGLIGILKYLNIIIYLKIFIILFFNIKYYRSKTSEILKILKSSSFIYICIIFILSFFVFRNNYLSGWDEFSHWGIYVKNMYFFDKVRDIKFSSLNGYSPLISLFQYYTLKISGNYNESILYMSLYIATMIPFSVVFNNKFNYKNLLLIFIIIMLPFTIFKAFFTSIYVDAIIGIYGGILIYNFFTDDFTIYNIIKNILMLSVLILIKDFGIIFVSIYIFMIITDMFFFRKERYSIEYKTVKLKNKILIILLLSSLPFLFKISWHMYISFIYPQASQLSTILSSRIIPSYIGELIKTFVYVSCLGNLRSGGSLINYSVFEWYLFFNALIIFASLIFNKIKKKEINLLFVMLSASFAIYLFALLLSYAFIFSEYEALRLASYERYISSLLISMIVFFTMYIIYLFKNYENKNNKYWKILFVMIYMLLIGFIPYKIIYKHVFTDALEKNKSKFFEEYKEVYMIQNYIKKASKVYYISNANDGFKYWVAKYILTPNHIQKDFWSIGKPYFETDIWAQDITIDEWKEKLSEADYLYIDFAGEQLKDNYSEVFENKNDINDKCLYSVEKNIVLVLVKCL